MEGYPLRSPSATDVKNGRESPILRFQRRATLNILTLLLLGTVTMEFDRDNLHADSADRKAWQSPEITDVAASSPLMGGFRLDDEPVNEDGPFS